MEESRIAQIGDLIFEQLKGHRYVGIVYKIIADKYNHKTVFINWAQSPHNYYKDRGYLLSNIHNQRQRFEVVKTCT